MVKVTSRHCCKVFRHEPNIRFKSLCRRYDERRQAMLRSCRLHKANVTFGQGQCLRPITSKDTTRIGESASTPQSGTSHKTCLRGFGGNGSIAWTSAVSHVGRTSNAFKVTMKLQTFLFQMVVHQMVHHVFLFSTCENMVLQNTLILFRIKTN
jgi:hypothetical protein